MRLLLTWPGTSLPLPLGWFTLNAHNKTPGRGMDNRRKTIVINKKFQYQYSLLIVALAVLLVNGFIIVRMLFPGEQPLALSTAFIVGLALVELALIAAFWWASLKASHRIAGPVYVFAREISRLGEGDLNAKIELRDRDMFQPEAEQMNRSIAALRARMDTIRELSGQLQAAHAAGKDVSSIVQKLVAELAAFTPPDQQ
ncbi:MAG: methyl-accepting chemotaxis protein [Halioglobus sp.]